MSAPPRPPQQRQRAGQAASSSLEYKGYTIWADRHGSWRVSREGVVVEAGAMPQDYYGRPRWGSRGLEAKAIEDAKAAIDAMGGDHGSTPSTDSDTGG